MLRQLQVRDFALIDSLSLEFASGFNVLTGETGAGKSIIMQAIDMLCGARASSDLIRSESEEATVEGLFDLGAAEIRALEEAGLPAVEDLLVRRTLSRSGKNRVYVNGSLANLAVLEQIGRHLIQIYGQHEQGTLLRPESHLQLLDAYAGHAAERDAMRETYRRLAERLAQLEELRRRQQSAAEREELIRFQLQELEAAALEEDEEDEHLRREREVLVNAERLLQTCAQGEEALYSGDDTVAGRLSRVAVRLRDISRVDSSLAEPAELLESALSQVEEVADRLRSYGERLSFDPARLETVDERLALLGRLKRKYGGSLQSAIATRDASVVELRGIEDGGAGADALAREVLECAAAAWTAAGELSQRRRAAAKRLERDVVRELRALGMKDARISVAFAADAVPSACDPAEPLRAGNTRLAENGADEVEFLLSANAGEPLKPLARIASGGELSRIMLALKVLTAGTGDVPSMIFDEVDAGIGGRIADAVGERLRALGTARQVLCITHLPQIAARAAHHFAVQKQSRGGRTVSLARPLGAEERVAELTRMLGGEDDAEAARFARRLVASTEPQGERERRRSSSRSSA